MEKQKWMAITVTTMEALNASIAEECRLFCVDEPLYQEVRYSMQSLPGANDYEITYCDELGFAMFKRIHGARKFDDKHFEPFYTTLIL